MSHDEIDHQIPALDDLSPEAEQANAVAMLEAYAAVIDNAFKNLRAKGFVVTSQRYPDKEAVDIRLAGRLKSGEFLTIIIPVENAEQ